MKAKGSIAALRLELCGTLPESVLNACALRGIELWDMECVDAYTLRLSLRPADRAELEAIAAQSMCDVKLISESAALRRRKTAKKRLWLAVFLFIVSMGLAISSLFVWDIRLEGCGDMSRGELLRALEDCGLYEGCFWPGISADRLSSLMMEKMPKIGRLSLSVSGSRALVTIKARREMPELYSPDEPAYIVAAESGIIRRCAVFDGQSLVDCAQAVTKGEPLVQGSPGARAEIWADTWREAGSVCPWLREKSPSGPVITRLALKFGKNRLNFYISSGKGLDLCDKIIKEYTIGAEGLFSLPVSIVVERLCPYTPGEMSPADMEGRQQRLYDALSSLIRGEIVEHSFKSSEAHGLSILYLSAQCSENIAERISQ